MKTSPLRPDRLVSHAGRFRLWVDRWFSKSRVGRSIWNYGIITVVAVLIWFWAAGETRMRNELNALVNFVVPDPERWVTNPTQRDIRIVIDGTHRSIDLAIKEAGEALAIELPARQQRLTLDLLDELRRNAVIEDTGVKIISVDPTTITIDIDEIIQSPAIVRSKFVGAQTTEVKIFPPNVKISMPQSLRRTLAENISVEAFVNRDDIKDLEPGVLHTLDVPLRMPEGLGANPEVTVDPNIVEVSFKLVSQTYEHLLDRVRIQVAGPPQDFGQYDIELTPGVLNNVNIIASADLIAQIAAKEAKVFAVIYLSANEKEQQISSKKISYFEAILPDGTGIPVQASVDGSNKMPEVQVVIKRRETPATPTNSTNP